MPVLVTGATGFVGRELVPKLVESGGQVRVYVRRDVPEYRALGVKVAVGDADHEGRLESALEQVHTLILLIGGPIPERGVTVEWLNLTTTQVAMRAAVNAEVARVLFLSHAGASEGSGDPYLASKWQAEEAIRSSGLEHAIFRTAPIAGPGGVLATLLERGVPARLKDVAVAPIALEDVAAALVAADTRGADVRGTWELGGRDRTTFGELADRFGSRAGLLTRPSRELVALYEKTPVGDPGDAVAQFGLELTSLDEALPRS